MTDAQSLTPALGKQVRPSTETNCLSEITDVHMADSLFLHDSGYFLLDWPTNAQYKKLKPFFLTSTGEMNKSHYPVVIPLIEFEPIMKVEINRIKHIRRGIFQL